MKYLLAIIACLSLAPISTAVLAEMYKHTDAEGVTTYSDTAEEGATLIAPTPSNTIKLPKYIPKKSIEKPSDVTYSKFSILSPEDGTTLRDNTGNVAVAMILAPELDIINKHSITIYLDNQVAVEKATTLIVSLDNIERGSHTIHAVVTDSAKKTLIQSNSVTLHIKRFSSQH